MDVKALIRFLNETEIGEDLLHSLGVERRPSALTSLASGLGVFLAGALVGAGLGLLFTPMTGTDMRVKARASIDEWRQKLMSIGQDLQNQAEGAVAGAKAAGHEPPQA